MKQFNFCYEISGNGGIVIQAKTEDEAREKFKDMSDHDLCGNCGQMDRDIDYVDEEDC